MSSYREDAEQRIAAEQAAYWLCELTDGGPQQREAFVAWLKRSPRHIAEFLEASAVWKEFGEASAMNKPEIERIVAEARALKDESNVVTLTGAQARQDEGAGTARPWRSRRMMKVAAAVAVVAVGTLTAMQFLFSGTDVYTTAVGEQRAFRLDDGSLLQLNTHSRIKVQYSEHARDVRLLQGEALFNVRGNPARPFRVQADDVVIEAIGTQFNVQRRERNIVVSVIEGRVSVNGRKELTTGGQVSIDSAGQIATVAKANVADAIAWRERRLVFENDRLEDIAQEVNRYTPGYIRLEGEAVRDKRITGTFDADDPASLVLFLKKLDVLAIEPADKGYVIRDRS